MSGPDGNDNQKLQSAADASPQVAAQRQLQHAANQSPQITAQRKQAHAMNKGSATPESDETEELLSEMGELMGADFSNVQLHLNSSKATAIDAAAFTQGNDIYFATGVTEPFWSNYGHTEVKMRYRRLWQ